MVAEHDGAPCMRAIFRPEAHNAISAHAH